MREKGLAICYISHRMEEIMQIGDRVTVLRDGKLIGCKNLHTEKVTIDDIISMMVGHSMEQQFPKQQFEKGEELLRVENLSCGEALPRCELFSAQGRSSLLCRACGRGTHRGG